MGRAIQELSSEENIQIAATINTASDWAKVRGDEVDVVVDFSTPEGFKE